MYKMFLHNKEARHHAGLFFFDIMSKVSLSVFADPFGEQQNDAK